MQPSEFTPPYQETVNYIHAGLPVYLNHGHLHQSPNYSYPYHYHRDVEFLCAVSGHLTYSVNGETVQIQQGEGIFVNSQHLHHGFSQDGTDCYYFCIVLNPMVLAVTPYLDRQYISPLTENPAFSHLVLKPENPWQNRILEQLNRAWKLYQDRPMGYMLELQSCFYAIWANLFAHMPQGDAQEPDNKLNTLRDMVGYLQAHSTERITLAQVAQAGHVCESTCCRLFQKYLHRSPVEYLNEYRLNQALDALRDTDLSITEIAFRVGFNGASYFTEQFRRAYGITPRQYRSQCRNKE